MLADVNFLNTIPIYHHIESTRFRDDNLFAKQNNGAYFAFSLDKGSDVIDHILQLHTALCWLFSIAQIFHSHSLKLIYYSKALSSYNYH